MKWYWYASRDNEIFCDLDSRMRLFHALGRLRRASAQVLSLDKAYVYESVTKGKFHMVVRLKNPMKPARRVRWGMYLGSDVVRGLYTLERIERGICWPDLLIRHEPIHRPWDAICNCAEKHKAVRITAHCEVMQFYHGSEAGAVYFAKNKDKKKREKILIPIGREIPLSILRRL